MKLAEIQAAEKKLMIQTYERSPHLFVSGQGVFLRDDEGNEYLDLLSGIGVSALGYGHPVVERAIAAQSRQLIHTSNLFFHEHTAGLAARLTRMSGLDRVFFTNSGTEAWEAAMKLARAHADADRACGGRLGTKFLALEHAFHGRTLGSIATTHKERYRLPFAPLLPTVEFVRFNDVADLRRNFSDEVCAICVETIQGEGGIHPVSPEFFAAARELCDRTGALLIADEIQCGFGRTGRWFAYQHLGILPDVTTLAKPMAGGLPIGAMLANERAAAAFTPGLHGTTSGGNPLSCAVAVAVIDEMERTDLLAHVAEIGGFFADELRALQTRQPAIVEVRGRGLMIGVDLESAELAKSVAADFLEARILINRTSETVLRFLPPYLLERVHVERAIAALEASLRARVPAHVHAGGGGLHA